MFATVVAPIQNYLRMPEIPALIGMAVLLLCSYAYLLYPFLHGRLRHIPGPWLSKVSNLFLGIYDLSYHRNEQILKWHRQYGPVISIAPNEVSVATLEATKDVYGATRRWAKSDYFDHFTGYNMRSIFATKPYEEHRAKRKSTAGFYQPSSIYKRPEIEQHVQWRAQAVLEQIQPGKAVDVYSLTDWYAFDNITYLAFGPEHCTRSVEHVCPERELLRELKFLQLVGPLRVRHPKFYAYISHILGRLSPWWSYLLADNKLGSWCQLRISAVMNSPHLFRSHSLLRHLLEVQEAKQSLDPRYIAAEVLDNINAAEATVAVTATYLIWRLTQAPEWQHRIRKELSSLPLEADGSVSFTDVNDKVPSLEACLREVYRLHPASSGRAERLVSKGGCTLSGVYLPEGTIVASSVVALHHDESVFPGPESFVPERWLDEEEEMLKIRDAQLIPFGHGGRICLGKAFATMEIKLLIARLYRKYETVTTASTSAESMKQYSTHDAVPKALECVVRFESVDGKNP